MDSSLTSPDIEASQIESSQIGGPSQIEASLTPTETIIQKTHEFVKNIMSKPPFDASHNYDHVCKVNHIALNLMHSGRSIHPNIRYDTTIVTLGALLHDALDHKFLPIPSIWNTIRGLWKKSAQVTPLSFLLSISCPRETAEAVQEICNGVSFSREEREPDAIREILALHPELAIVQDADRLEAMGAIGLARCFTFGATERGRRRDMDVSMTYLMKRTNDAVAMMKTDSGKREARVSFEKMTIFDSWFQAEEQGNVGMNYQDWAALS